MIFVEFKKSMKNRILRGELCAIISSFSISIGIDRARIIDKFQQLIYPT